MTVFPKAVRQLSSGTAYGGPFSCQLLSDMTLEEYASLCYNAPVAPGREECRVRCSCKECGTYMIQAESERLGCVCPDCGYRCDDCLGTNTVVSREHLKDLAFDRRFDPEELAASFRRSEDEEWFDNGGYEQ